LTLAYGHDIIVKPSKNRTNFETSCWKAK